MNARLAVLTIDARIGSFFFLILIELNLEDRSALAAALS